jgi:radical SAM/Cys-rich protein
VSPLHRTFAATVRSFGADYDHALPRLSLLEVNVSCRCNMRCSHCQHSCSPDREELMSADVFERVLAGANELHPETVDLTGGAPELHPLIERFISALVEAGHPVQLRTNLTSLLEAPARHLPGFFAEHGVRLLASLPAPAEESTSHQRGAGAFEASVEALRRLAGAGYGSDGLQLDLVHNPDGPHLPRPEAELTAQYREELEPLGVRFGRVLTMTNMPLGRFRRHLVAGGRLEGYLQELRDAFNPETLPHLPCRKQIEVAWDGSIWDCDFNLACSLPLLPGGPRTLADIAAQGPGRRIAFGEHCWGCAAGAGSS